MTDLKMGRKKTVNAETAQKIAGFFGVSVAYLLGQEAEAGLLDQVDVAFYGEFKELNEEEKENGSLLSAFSDRFGILAEYFE